MHAFLSNLAHRRQTDKRTRAKTYTSSFIGDKRVPHNLSLRQQKHLNARISARKTVIKLLLLNSYQFFNNQNTRNLAQFTFSSSKLVPCAATLTSTLMEAEQALWLQNVNHSSCEQHNEHYEEYWRCLLTYMHNPEKRRA